MKVTTDKIGPERIDIEVDSNGKFSATFEEATYRGDTLDQVREQLAKAIKKRKATEPIDVTVLGVIPKTKSDHYVEGPFKEGPGFVQAKLRGVHGTRRGVYLLVTDDDRFATEKFQIGGYNMDDPDIVRRLPLEDCARYLKLLEAQRQAKTAIEDFIGAAKFDIEEALEAARKVKA